MRAFVRSPKGARMSGKHRESLIKTPKQLVTVLVLFFVGTIIVIILLAKLATSGRTYDKDSPAMSPEEIAKRIKPVAEVNMGAAGPAGGVLKTGEEVYKSVCTACHATGIAKAPKFGDRRDWAARLGEGQKKLVQVALKGEGGMPPRGGASDLSDLEVDRAVVYIANAAAIRFGRSDFRPQGRLHDRSSRSHRPHDGAHRAVHRFLHAGARHEARAFRGRPHGAQVRRPEDQSPRKRQGIRAQGDNGLARHARHLLYRGSAPREGDRSPRRVQRAYHRGTGDEDRRAGTDPLGVRARSGRQPR